LIHLHAWLPLAHPAAPSHVSALMSGVMTKVAIYGFVRIAFDLLGPPDWWWALPPIVLGAMTAVLGLLYAVLDRDLKRVLAYSTIENIGVIFVALGLALAFSANAQHEAAAVAMAAALLHVLNHSWFKSLLFLGAGAILHATGRRDLDGLGGLIRRMPRTAAFFLVGALAISALPPLNGFVSEWLLFQAVIAAPALPQAALHFASPAIGAMLALAAALAAACFVRVYGTAFLGRPRSAEAAGAHDVPLAQQAAMGGLAFLCILGGLMGSVLAAALAPVLHKLVGGALPGPGSGPTPFSLIAFDPARSIYDAPVIALFVAIASLTTLIVVHRLSERRTRRGPAWDCGFPDPSPATQYTASSFAQPLRRVYGAAAFAARETVVMPPPGDIRPARFSVVVVDHLWRVFYAAPGQAVLGLSERLNVLQFLTIRRYLVLMFVTLVILLSIAAVTT
jgi:NADH:ubiquinone oxidoreductase subunit 5 (subunit L)/multisubunit Na+/H+ antiporter MnhA subunit